jgi:hypothetical protein
MNTDAISNRAVGQYNLSIATSLAKEALCGIHEDYPTEYPPIKDYQELYVNTRTLFRNLMGSLNKEDAGLVLPNQVAAEIAVEMDVITSIVNDVTKGKTKVVFYYSDYANMTHLYKHAQLRVDNTPKQKEYTAFHNLTMNILLTEHPSEIVKFTLKIKSPVKTKALILTHYAYDLLSYREFNKLVLIESHTGKLKDRALWYTKYYQGSNLSMIPFREDLIQVFGDNEQFQPMPIKVRREIIDIATHYKWSAVSTYDKLSMSISAIKDPYTRAILQEVLIRNG